MTQVNIENIGTFHIPNEKAVDLADWLESNDGIKTKSKDEQIKEIIEKQNNGLELING
jgi:hypothetical protein